MKYSIGFAIATISIVTLLSSCDRDKSISIGGKGGKGTLNITPRHHSRNIDSCKVYIKYNESDKPLIYDDSVWCKNVGGNPVGTFTGLKRGKYYLYGKGWDADGQYDVDGGAPYEIKEETTLSYTLAVTEDH
ncbi:MAG: hypothetical protein EOP56_14635 [Sphingobacteriales bacterium]|nr:MAG: hypothetical protein EOP56_14635 [Sphingobacteriales bacterium]